MDWLDVRRVDGKGKEIACGWKANAAGRCRPAVFGNCGFQNDGNSRADF